MQDGDLLSRLREHSFAILKDALPPESRGALEDLQSFVNTEIESGSVSSDSPLARCFASRYTLSPKDVDGLLAQLGYAADLESLIGRYTEAVVSEAAQGRPYRRSPYGGMFVSHPLLPRANDFFWHPDGHFDGLMDYGVNFWIPIRSCGDDAPGLSVVDAPEDRIRTSYEFLTPAATCPIPAPRRQGSGPTYTPVAWHAVADEELRGFFGSHAVTSLRFDFGDVLVFTGMTIHRTDFSPAMRTGRCALILRYNILA